MNSGTVRVTVEWALWGMESREAGNCVLRCSAGVLAAENFETVLDRYFPGMLDDRLLPQVTLGWLSDRDQQDYIAFAFHELGDQREVGGGQARFTRCFCVPYAALAAGPVSYQAVFDHFRDVQIPHRSRDVLTADLPVMTAGADPDPLAMRAAELLLTCQPVCILGAEALGFAARLRFFDAVMSLLPYGLRSQVSASTLTNSMYYEHKFRLFFSTAPRAGGDHIVNWSERENLRVRQDDHDAGKYVNWLANVSRLGTLTDPIRFRPAEADSLRELLFTAPGVSAQPWSPAGSGEFPVGQAAGQDVEELLIDCADKMLGYAPEPIKDAIERLSGHCYDQVTPERRQRYREIVRDRQLFRQRLPLRGKEKSDFYKIVMQLAFDIPLTYLDYCLIEDSVGIEPGEQLHKSLLLAVSTTPFADFCLRLLVLKASGDEDLDDALYDDEVSPAVLIATAADPRLRVDHGEIVYKIAVGHLLKRSDHYDEQVIRDELSRWDYLAPTLQRLYAGKFETQTTELGQLLSLAYRNGLDSPAIRQIFGNADFLPTLALCSAVSAMVGPEDAQLVEQAFSGSASRMRTQLLGQLDHARRPDPDDNGPRPAQDRSAVTRLLRGRHK